MLHRMQDAGPVARDQDPGDARVFRLLLTEHGSRIHAASEGLQCRLREDLGLEPEEVRRLQTALRDIGNSMEQALTEAD